MTADPATGPIRFAYWVPNVSDGLVMSAIEQRTDWSFEYVPVVASPTHKTACSGLPKAFLDRFSNRPLVGTAAPVLPGEPSSTWWRWTSTSRRCCWS